MTTPATPAPKDPHDFPVDLLDAQRELAGLYAELHAHQATLPWAREPQPGWEAETEHGRRRAGREQTDGWPADGANTFDKLMQKIREKAESVQCHGWWAQFTGPALVDARQALKQKAAAPLVQGDVDRAA